jgi:hypothetical protein
MATKHFRTTDAILITYDDTKYVLNNYGGEGNIFEVVRLSTSTPIIKIWKGVGTEFIDFTGITNTTFLGMIRLTLP